MLSREEQVKVLIETLEKVEKPTKWKDLAELEPLKSHIGQPKDTKLPSANSHRSVMSSKRFSEDYKIFVREKDIVVFYSLSNNYKQEFERLQKESNK